MKSEAQRWGDKRYQSLNYFLRQKFGQKVFKIPLDAGFSCPNRDGTLSTGGCAFCSARGSGDFTASKELALSEQFRYGTEMMNRKWNGTQYIAYLQAFSNTHAPLGRLRQIYEEVLSQPGVFGLAIATRPDCLGPDVLALLQEMSEKTYLWVELGLQSIHTRTAESLNLGYNCETFLRAVEDLTSLQIETCAHIILGLPGESREDMLETGLAVSRLPLQGLKIHSLHVMKGTPLEARFAAGSFDLLTQAEYIEILCSILERLSPDLVLHRLTGDGPKNLLIGPSWSLNKWQVLNGIDQELIRRNTWQGKFYEIR